MSPEVHRRNRLNVLLQMVTAFITAILLGQLWLFTVTLDAMENSSASMTIVVAATLCSLVASSAVWVLIRFFLTTEQTETGDRS
jgi:hypothetical protein